jgi:hypothetical protein
MHTALALGGMKPFFPEQETTSSVCILKRGGDNINFLANFQSNWNRDVLCTECTKVQVSPEANLWNDLGTSES